MPTSYTSLLGLALPVTGELSGTWGDTVNDYITQYLDASVAGTQTISGSQTAVTLSKTTATSLSQAGSGATGSSQYNIINCTGNPASMLTVTVPAASKTYVVVNATSTNQDVKIVGAGPTTGVTLVAGEKAVIAWNGSDFIKIATSTADGVTTLSFGSTGLTPSTATSGAVTVAGTLVAANGGTGQSTYTTGDLLYATGSTALSKLGIGTNGQVLTSTGTAPQWSTLSGVAVTTFSAGTTGFTPSTATSGAVTLAGTLATTNGGTGLTSFTANRVFYASSTSAIGQSANLAFDGTNLGVGTASPGFRLDAVNNAAGLARFSFSNPNAGMTQTDLRIGAGSNINDIFVGIQSGNSFIDDRSTNGALLFSRSGTEQMRLTSTGLGIGTSSPSVKLDVFGRAKIDVGTYASGYALTLGAISETGRTYQIGMVTGGSLAIYDSAAAAQRVVLDTSGNLGLGVTPSAWSASYKAISVGYAGGQQMAGGTANTQSLWTANLVFTGTGATGWKLPNNVAGTTYEQYLGAHKWYNAPANGVNGDATLTQAMTLDASGNLGLGETSPYSLANYGAMTIRGSVGGLTMYRSGSTNIGYVGGNNSDELFIANLRSSGYITLATNSTERARITSGGDFAAFGGLQLWPSAAGGAGSYSIRRAATNALSFNYDFTGAELARFTSVGNFSLGGTADRGTTVGTAALQLFNGTAPAGTLTNGVSLYSQSGDLRFMDAAGNAYQVGFRNVPQSGSAKTTSYTLATTDVGEYIQVGSGGSITIPDATFATGDVVSVFNNTTGNITITCSITTAYIAGTDSDKATMTLATRGVATILFISGTVCVVTGNVT